MIAVSKFGTLDDVPLVEAWAHEAREFTPSLADALGVKIGGPTHLFVSGLPVADAHDRARWDEMADWLAARNSAYSMRCTGCPRRSRDDSRSVRRAGRAMGTMHLAKGLEFKTVATMACDEEILPQQTRVETVADDVELDEVYETERHLCSTSPAPVPGIACSYSPSRPIMGVHGLRDMHRYLPRLANAIST